MLNKLETYFEQHKGMGLFFLRIFIGLRLLYGVVDNVLSWERMMEFSGFLTKMGFIAPTFHAVVSVYAQFICSLLILVGFKTRMASLIMVFNFIVAMVFVHLKIHDTVEGMTPALAMLFGSLCLSFTGSGNYSLDGKSRKA